MAISGRVSLAAWAAIGQAHLARAAGTSNESGLKTLTRVARLIYPHDGLTDDVYAGIVGELLVDPDIGDSVEAGLSDLGDFLEMDLQAQGALLIRLQEGEFFTTLKTPLMWALYNTRELWDLIDYPGPSFPIGYADRGFDDIDWLPGR